MQPQLSSNFSRLAGTPRKQKRSQRNARRVAQPSAVFSLILFIIILNKTSRQNESVTEPGRKTRFNFCSVL
jgi:hypothetical protein